MSSTALHRVEELIRGLRTPEDVAEVERLIEEVKEGIALCTQGETVWERTRPCWELCECPRYLRFDCPATGHLSACCDQAARKRCTIRAAKWRAKIRVLGRGMNAAFYLVRADDSESPPLN